ncbi:MAG: hypothetical protein GY851_29125 [bacterium]|nr:hypothetical protein [bacterium]
MKLGFRTPPLIDDTTPWRLFTKARRVGHVVAICTALSLGFHSYLFGSAELSGAKLAATGFLCFGWFIVMPLTLIVADPKYQVSLKRLNQLQKLMLLYLWPPVFIAGFAYLAATSWNRPFP